MGPCYVVKVIVQVIFTESEVEVKVMVKVKALRIV